MASKLTKAELEEQLQRLKEETDIRIAKLENELARLQSDKVVAELNAIRAVEDLSRLRKYLAYVKSYDRNLWRDLYSQYPGLPGFEEEKQ